MNKTKTRFITIIACFALLALLLGLAIGALTPTVTADAASTSPSSIFWAMTGGEVRSYSEKQADAEADDPFGYVTLVLADNGRTEGSVEYHKDLALKWYLPVQVNTKEDNKTTASEHLSAIAKGDLQYFSMTFSFPAINFDTFTIALSGAEENVTKDGKSVNELIFKKDSSGNVYAFLKDSSLQDDDHKDYDPKEAAERLVLTNPTADIELTISEDETCGAGEFLLKLNGETVGDPENSKLTNVGGYFMEYRSSSNANVPLSFKVVTPTAGNPQKVLMKQLNGQTLKVTGGSANKENGATKVESDGTVLYTGGSVTDDAPPAFVVNSKVYAFTLGQRYSPDYEVMDVCSDSPTVTRYYYMAKKDADGNLVLPDFIERTKKDGYQQLSTNTYFLPTQETEDETAYVSIRFTVKDGMDGAEDRYYYLAWYADADSVENKNGLDYIRVDRAKTAPYYSIIETDAKNEDGSVRKENVKTEGYQTAVKNYQAQLDEAAKKVSAGDGAYFYLPSLRDLIQSNSADYRNLRFNIYYYKPGVAEGSSASSETSLRYNNLRFEIEEPGTYKFRIMASDAAGNTMQMYIDEGEDNMKLTNLTASNIWDVKEIPDFTIDVGYTGATVESAEGGTTLGYRGSSYSISNFDIVAYGNSKREYSLYYFDSSKIKNNAKGPSLDELTANTENYFNDDNYKDCFVEIRKYNSDVTQEDEEAWNRTDNAYNWNPGTTPGSFTPQESGLYVVCLTLTDGYIEAEPLTAYQVIDIRNPVDVTPGQIDWLKNNVTSVVLFAISAVLAVAIVVLFVVKPSEKSVEDVDLDKLKGKKNNKK